MNILDEYEQASTGVINRKTTGYTQSDEMKHIMVDDIWGWKEDRMDDEHNKEEYFLFLD